MVTSPAACGAAGVTTPEAAFMYTVVLPPLIVITPSLVACAYSPSAARKSTLQAVNTPHIGLFTLHLERDPTQRPGINSPDILSLFAFAIATQKASSCDMCRTFPLPPTAAGGHLHPVMVLVESGEIRMMR